MIKSIALICFLYVVTSLALSQIEKLACGENQPYLITSSSGNIYSPGYVDGQKYPNNLECSYAFLYRNRNQVTEFTINDLELETKDQCEGDHIHFVANQQSAKLVCGGETPMKFTTPPFPVQIIFKSDFQNNFRGFNISYKIVNTTNSALYPCKEGYGKCFTGRVEKCVPMSKACDGVLDCEDGSDERNCMSRPLSKSVTCGVPTVSADLTTDRVVGGQEAVPGSWPWQADLQLNPVVPSGHVCGGTLINDQWILSAAHCFQGVRQNGLWRITLGNHDKYGRTGPEQIRGIEKKFIYGVDGSSIFQQFNPQTDISLFKLFAPLNFTDYVRPVCLPPAGHRFKPGTLCYATGWGETRGTGSNRYLKQVQLEIQDIEKCRNVFVPDINNQTIICAGHMTGFNGVCHGDSGGPLVCKENGKWYLAGVSGFVTDTNFISGICGVPNSPSGFGRVANYVDWINEIVKSN